MKQEVAKSRNYRKGGRPCNRLQIVIADIVMDDFLRRNVEDWPEDEPRYRHKKREPQERRHRRELLRLQRIPKKLCGDNSAGAERGYRQESPGKGWINRSEEVGYLQAPDQNCIAKPRRSKERASGFPLPENCCPQKPEVEAAGKIN
jgi:hypothetical protein